MGVSTQTRSCKSSAWAWAAPDVRNRRSDGLRRRRQPRQGAIRSIRRSAAWCCPRRSRVHPSERPVRPAGVVRNPADRSADHHDLGFRNACFQIGRALVDDPALCACWSVCGLRPTPTTRAATPRERMPARSSPRSAPRPRSPPFPGAARRLPFNGVQLFRSRPDLHEFFILTSPPPPKRDRTSDSGWAARPIRRGPSQPGPVLAGYFRKARRACHMAPADFHRECGRFLKALSKICSRASGALGR